MSATRNKHLSIRFTKEERSLINLAASTQNRTAADWARLIILTQCRELFPEQDETGQEAA